MTAQQKEEEKPSVTTNADMKLELDKKAQLELHRIYKGTSLKVDDVDLKAPRELRPAALKQEVVKWANILAAEQEQQQKPKKKRGRPPKSQAAKKKPAKVPKRDWIFVEKKHRAKWNRDVQTMGSTQDATTLTSLITEWFQYTTTPIDKTTILELDKALVFHVKNKGTCCYLINSLSKFANEEFGRPEHRELLLQCGFLEMVGRFMSHKEPTEDGSGIEEYNKDVDVTQCGLMAISVVLGNHTSYQVSGGDGDYFTTSIMEPVMAAFSNFPHNAKVIFFACNALKNLLFFNPGPCSQKLLELGGPAILLQALQHYQQIGDLLVTSWLVTVFCELSNAVDGANLSKVVKVDHKLIFAITDVMILFQDEVPPNTTADSNGDSDDNNESRENLFGYGFLFLFNVTSVDCGRRDIRDRKLAELIQVMKKVIDLPIALENFLGLLSNLFKNEKTFSKLKGSEKDIREIVSRTLEIHHKECPLVVDWAFEIMAIFPAKLAAKEIGEDGFFDLAISIVDSYTKQLASDGSVEEQQQEVYLSALCSAMKALEELGKGCAENLTKIWCPKATPILLAAMFASPADSDVQEHGCNMLLDLTSGVSSDAFDAAFGVCGDRLLMDHFARLSRCDNSDIIQEKCQLLLTNLTRKITSIMVSSPMDRPDQKKGCKLLTRMIPVNETVASTLLGDHHNNKMMEHLTQLANSSIDSDVQPNWKSLLTALFEQNGETLVQQISEAQRQLDLGGSTNLAYSFVVELKIAKQTGMVIKQEEDDYDSS